MRTKPIAPAPPKQKLSLSRKPTRRFPNLARQMAELKALREKVREAEARTTMH
jgi:hypothetical protein